MKIFKVILVVLILYVSYVDSLNNFEIVIKYLVFLSVVAIGIYELISFSLCRKDKNY